MITKSLLIWLSLISPNWTEIQNSNIIPQTQERIHDTFSQRFHMNEKSTVSTEKFFEVLQDNIKQQIIQWTLIYFENDVTCTLSEQEKNQLKIDMQNYVNKHPNIIKTRWNSIILNLDDSNFRELFRTLLPYLWRWDELRRYPDIIKNNDGLLIRHITKSRWQDAEKYFFHQFGYLIMRIVEQMPWDMTIWYYRQEMLKVVPNKHIKNTDYSNISNLSITELPKYF